MWFDASDQQFLKFHWIIIHQVTGTLPDQTTVRALQKIAWSTSGECLHLVHSSHDEIHKSMEASSSQDRQLEHDDISVSREALEVLTICLALCPDTIDMICKEKNWQFFIIDLLLVCHSRSVQLFPSNFQLLIFLIFDFQILIKSIEYVTLVTWVLQQTLQSEFPAWVPKKSIWSFFKLVFMSCDLVFHFVIRPIRTSASEQFYLMATSCAAGHKMTIYFITLLFTVLSVSKVSFSRIFRYFLLLILISVERFFSNILKFIKNSHFYEYLILISDYCLGCSGSHMLASASSQWTTRFDYNIFEIYNLK